MPNNRVESQLSTISRLMIWQSRNAINGFWKRALFVKIGDVVALTAAYNALSPSPTKTLLIPAFFSNRWNRYKYSLPPCTHIHAHGASFSLSLSFFSFPLRRPFLPPTSTFFPQRVFAIVFFFFLFFFSSSSSSSLLAWLFRVHARGQSKKRTEN